MLGTSLGTVINGIETRIVKVEADVSRGLPQFSIVGLPDSAVTESKLRIRSAILNTGLAFPQQRITVNLSPASLRKRGAGLDLPIAVAILRASGQVPGNMVTQAAFCGELALSGAIVPVESIVNTALGLHRAEVHELYLPGTQAHEGVSLPPLKWYAVDTLSEVVCALRDPERRRLLTFRDSIFHDADPAEDMADVAGLDQVKRGLVIAATGRHHTLIVGPPGCGKSMIAQRFPSILPRLSDEQAIHSYALWQSAGTATRLSHIPPLRMPHHSLTTSGLIGGGASVHPGEVTLAHHGVLVLDELLEFRRNTLEALREPLVHQQIHLARSGNHVTLPADFQLLGTLNPCPCGYHGSAECHCSQREIQQYWSVLSGPVLDRIPITLFIPPYPHRAATSSNTFAGVTSADFRETVTQARKRLLQRSNALPRQREGLTLDDFAGEAKTMMQTIAEKLHLTRRGLKAIESVARSISVVEGRSHVVTEDIHEALTLRSSVAF